jgi:hypothetical protein
LIFFKRAAQQSEFVPPGFQPERGNTLASEIVAGMPGRTWSQGLHGVLAYIENGGYFLYGLKHLADHVDHA